MRNAFHFCLSLPVNKARISPKTSYSFLQYQYEFVNIFIVYRSAYLKVFLLRTISKGLSVRNFQINHFFQFLFI